MSLLIKNGEIVTASERYVADIFCEDDTITRIERNIPPPPGAEIIDAAGHYVFGQFIADRPGLRAGADYGNRTRGESMFKITDRHCRRARDLLSKHLIQHAPALARPGGRDDVSLSPAFD